MAEMQALCRDPLFFAVWAGSKTIEFAKKSMSFLFLVNIAALFQDVFPRHAGKLLQNATTFCMFYNYRIVQIVATTICKKLWWNSFASFVLARLCFIWLVLLALCFIVLSIKVFSSSAHCTIHLPSLIGWHRPRVGRRRAAQKTGARRCAKKWVSGVALHKQALSARSQAPSTPMSYRASGRACLGGPQNRGERQVLQNPL